MRAEICVYRMMILESMEGVIVTAEVHCLGFGVVVVSIKKLCESLTATYSETTLTDPS